MVHACIFLLWLLPDFSFTGTTGVRVTSVQTYRAVLQIAKLNESEPTLELVKTVLGKVGDCTDEIAKIRQQVLIAPEELAAVASELTNSLIHGGYSDKSWRSKLKALTIMRELMHNKNAVKTFRNSIALRSALTELRYTNNHRNIFYHREDIRGLATGIATALTIAQTHRTRLPAEKSNEADVGTAQSALDLVKTVLSKRSPLALVRTDEIAKICRQLLKSPAELLAVASELTNVLRQNEDSENSWRSKMKALAIMSELMHNKRAMETFRSMDALRGALAELRFASEDHKDLHRREDIRRLANEITVTCFVQSPPKPPSLGKFGNYFSLDRFIVRGGEAEAWTGTDSRNKQRPIVVRFPLGLCTSWPCLVEELPNERLWDMTSGCAMSWLAMGRYKDRASGTPSLRRAPFAECLFIQASPSQKHEPAFDVWDHAGDVSMAQGFFMSSKLGALSVESKRRILRQLMHAVAILADETKAEATCCCFQDPWHSMCTTDFASKADMDWGMLTYMRLRGQRCPQDWVEDPDKCGPLVHHDINFNNVMLDSMQQGSTHKIIPTLIDFGGARRCRDGSEAFGWSPAYSKDWVPFWLEDPHSWSRHECWSYDIYAVGLAWLVMEFLREMPPRHLICNAAAKAGLIATSSLVFRWGGATDTQPLKLVHACDSFKQNELLRQDAMIPVDLLIRELKNRVLNDESLATPTHFASKINEFVVSDRDSLPEKIRMLPLLVPEKSVLTEEVYPLLKRCPHFPHLLMVGPNANRKAEILCNAQVIIKIYEARHSYASMAEGVLDTFHWKQACKELQSFVKDFHDTSLPESPWNATEALTICRFKYLPRLPVVTGEARTKFKG